jgi:hypothetical protein
MPPFWSDVARTNHIITKTTHNNTHHNTTTTHHTPPKQQEATNSSPNKQTQENFGRSRGRQQLMPPPDRRLSARYPEFHTLLAKQFDRPQVHNLVLSQLKHKYE